MRALCFMLVVAVLLGCAGGDGTPKAKVRTREELKAAVMGKSKEEVLKVLGKPLRTSEYEFGDAWTYEWTSYDPVAEKVDRNTTIWFSKGGVANDIRF